MTREEALDFAKRRALEYVERGDFEQAVASMGSDLRGSGVPELELHPGLVIGLGYLLLPSRPSIEQFRAWVRGFN